MELFKQIYCRWENKNNIFHDNLLLLIFLCSSRKQKKGKMFFHFLFCLTFSSSVFGLSWRVYCFSSCHILLNVIILMIFPKNVCMWLLVPYENIVKYRASAEFFFLFERRSAEFCRTVKTINIISFTCLRVWLELEERNNIERKVSLHWCIHV